MIGFLFLCKYICNVVNNKNNIFLFLFLGSTVTQKIILTPDNFSKITTNHKQKSDLILPVAPLVSSTSEVNTPLSLSASEIDLQKSRCNSSNTLQYTQVIILYDFVCIKYKVTSLKSYKCGISI